MQRSRLAHIAALLGVFCVLLLFSITVVTAQGQNLLVNPGFESPFQAQGGEPVRQVAQGWTAWNAERVSGATSYVNQQPEYAQVTGNAARIHSGSSAQVYSTFFATHSAGVYQTVSNATAGTVYTFQVHAYLWSSNYDAVNVSDQDGGVAFQVGIDPTGGTNPDSSSIVWSVAAQNYDKWHPYAVSTAATSNTLTVFVRSTSSAPVKNTFVYLYTASLFPEGAGGVEPEPTVAPTNVPPTVAPTQAPTDVPATSVPTDVAVDPTEDTGVEPTAVQPTEDAGVQEPTLAPTDIPVTVISPIAPPPTVDVVTSTPAPTLTAVPSPTVDGNVFLSTITYVVLPGDTVQRIAQVYGSTIEAINSANGLTNFSIIYVGQELVVPVRIPPIVPPVEATAIPAQPTQVPAATSLPSDQVQVTTYQVQRGDTLSSIASRFNTTVPILASLNGIVNPDRILVGQWLNIPTTSAPAPQPTTVPPTVAPQPTTPDVATYQVQPGDTLYRISVRFNVSLTDLIRLNGITNPNRIYWGQVLKLR